MSDAKWWESSPSRLRRGTCPGCDAELVWTVYIEVVHPDATYQASVIIWRCPTKDCGVRYEWTDSSPRLRRNEDGTVEEVPRSPPDPVVRVTFEMIDGELRKDTELV